MYDEFEPDPEVTCAECREVLYGFQGKDGPRLLLRWRQGVPTAEVPAHCADWLDVDRIATLRLPERFVFYTSCEACGADATLTGFSKDSVWVESVTGDHLSSGPVIPARSVHQDWRQCTGCAEAWEHPDASIRAGCPSCHALTRLEP